MTVSMLRGEAGRQGKELRRLVEWLAAEQPDAVILSNALLAGLAPAIKDRTRSAVLCLLQDENAWIDFLPEPYRTQSWDAIRSAGRASDGFIAVSRYYAALMAERLALPQSRLHVVYPGIPLADFGEPAAAETPAIGYLARMSRGMGLDILGAAFLILRRQNPARRVVLKIAGGQTADDAAFVRALFARFAAAGARECVAVVPELDRAARIAFLHSLAVATVPARDPLAFGIFILEALAAGVPVVLPATGAFPEVVDATGGGLTYAPNTPEALAAALGSLLAEAERRRALGLRGRADVQQRFTIEQTAAEIAALCAHYAGERR
jgi:glycosyltransferase involved in cell wall biosynthesis